MKNLPDPRRRNRSVLLHSESNRILKERNMSNRAMNQIRPFTLFCCVALMAATASLASAQGSIKQSRNNQNPGVRSIPNGSKMKFQGVVISRDADTFTNLERSRSDYQGLITDN